MALKILFTALPYAKRAAADSDITLKTLKPIFSAASLKDQNKVEMLIQADSLFG